MRIHYKSLKPYRDYQRDRMLGFRLRFVRGAMIACFALFALVFWYMQIAHGEEFRRRAEENRLRRQVERPVRGVIRDATGAIVASNRPSFTVYLDRQRTTAPEAEIAALAALVRESPQEMLSSLERGAGVPKFLPLPISDDVGLETAARIGAHRPELPAVDVVVESRRFYPLGPAAAHVIGYLSEVTIAELRAKDELLPGDRAGRTGAESLLDNALRGRPGLLLEEVNARGRPLRTVDTVRPTQHGRSLQVTIDGAMQRDVYEAFAGRSGAAVFLDPRSGAIRALYSGPSFDPNVFSGRLSPETWTALSGDARRPLQNRAVAGTYSPGSTFKIVMAVAALEEGVITEDERVFCPGAARFHGQLRRCHFSGGHGWVDVRKAIERSCNIFFYTVGQRLGIEPIAEWAFRFGLGQRSGLLPESESAGLVPTAEWKRRARGEPWYPGETISVSIGQGPLMVTPLQMAIASAAVANGGRIVVPHLRDRAGMRREASRFDADSRTLRLVRSGMTDVVEGERGTARRARVPGVRLAGKTGTAQVVSLASASDPGDHAWFVGYGPVDDPALAWAVIVENAGHGGSQAAPVVRTVVSRYLERRHAATEDALPVLARRRAP